MSRVHRNLHLSCWTLYMRSSGPPLHLDAVALKGVRFVVQPGGRARFLVTRRRKVHAYAQGELTYPPDLDGDAVEVTYNPHRCATFTRRDTGAPVWRAALVLFHTDGRAYAWRPEEEP